MIISAVALAEFDLFDLSSWIDCPCSRWKRRSVAQRDMWCALIGEIWLKGSSRADHHPLEEKLNMSLDI